MRTIQKIISLEQMTSRVPSVWPAYKDNKLYFFDDESLNEREFEHPTNYGMIPLSLSISLLATENGNKYTLSCEDGKGYTMSFDRICHIYTFFKKYNHLLNKAGHCGRIYTSAVDYYNTEIDNIYSDDLEYGTSKEVYVDLDNKFIEYGGNDFFEWINLNIIPTYYISNAYKKYWKRDNLYYSDVIKWIAWFRDRIDYENEAEYSDKTDVDIEHWNCKLNGISDCCDCEEYFKRGGLRELTLMEEWYEKIQENIKQINKIVVGSDGNVLSCFTPSIYEHIELSNSLYDIGQYSVLSPEYELGIDYRVADGYGEFENTKSGTTVIDESGNTRILKEGEKGFCFSPSFAEKIFDNDAWDDYIDVYIKDNPEEFKSLPYSYYAFDDENKFYSGNTIIDVINAMENGKTYDITPTNSILIDDALIPIETTEYGIYDTNNTILSGRTYFVYREKNTSTPYTLINGKKIYAEPYLSPTGMCYYFSFFKNTDYEEKNNTSCDDLPNFDINRYKKFGRTKGDDLKKIISYNDRTYVINDESNSIKIDDVNYFLISGYSYDIYGNIMYLIKNNSKVYDEDLNELPSTYSLHDTENKIYVNKYNDNVIIYSAKEITGYTSSKLSDLASINRLCDDTGNNINGIYNDTCKRINGQEEISAITYAQPPIYTELEPLYQVGNVSLIGRFKLTKENISEIGENSFNYFIGNIITSMVFYYKDVNGNKIEETVSKCEESISSLSAIKKSTNKKNEIDESSSTIVFDENLYCDIEYYIGATLQRSSNDASFELANGYNYGVRYNETVKFVKTPTFYRLKMELDEEEIMPTQVYVTKNLSHKYPIYTYEIEQNIQEIENDTYKTAYQTPIAKFTTEINTFDSSLTSNFSGYSDMDKYNDMDVSPVYKEEYKLGVAMKEKVDADIYIDRGINAAFEKHLKLQEVNSLEALTQYGNNYFKIMNN